MLNKPLLNFAVPPAENVMMHDWWLALYAAAYGEIGFVDQRLVKYGQHGGNAGGKVVFGSTVDVYEEEEDAEHTFQIVGDDEADYKNGLISVSSPMARALIGKQVDDVAVVDTPKGPRHMEIVAVRYE